MLLPPRALGALFAIFVCLVPSVARGQVSPPPAQDDESRPRIRFGGISINPTIALTNTGVDGNVFNTVDDPKQDYTSTLSPGMDMWIRGGKIRMALRGRADLVYFQKYRSERSIDGGFAERLEIPLNRIIPWYEGGVYSGRQRVGYEIDLRSRRMENSLGGGINLRVAAKTIIGAGVRRSTTAWDADAQVLGTSLREYLDRRSESATLSYSQELTALTTFVVEAEASRDRFTYANQRDTDSVRAVTGFNLKTRALVDGRARVGYRRFDPRGGGFEPFRGIVAAADLGYSIRGVTRLAVRIDRDANFSFEPFYPYYLQTGAGAAVTQRVTGRWDVQGVIGRQDLAYRPRAGVTDGVLSGRIDRIDQRGGGIGYRPNREMRISFNVEKQRRRSPVQRRSYNGYRVGASVTYAR